MKSSSGQTSSDNNDDSIPPNFRLPDWPLCVGLALEDVPTVLVDCLTIDFDGSVPGSIGDQIDMEGKVFCS